MAVQKTNSMKRQPKSAARESADIGKAFASRNESDHTVKLTVVLDSRLHRELKAAAALQSVTIREDIHDAGEAEEKQYKDWLQYLQVLYLQLGSLPVHHGHFTRREHRALH